MAATDEQKARLRRMVAEPTSATYSDTTLAGYIERFPLPDSMGRDPYRVSAATPPAIEANPDWTATYDLNAAAADVWDEKAGAAADKFDFSEDGQSFSRAQLMAHCSDRARYYRARRSVSVIKLRPDFLEPSDATPIANRPIVNEWW